MTTMTTTTMATTTIPPHHHTGSYNRQKDWKKCCAVAMGFEWVDEFNDNENISTKHDGVHHEEEKTTTTQKKKNIDMMMMIGGVGGPILQITNLLDGSEFENPLVISDNSNNNTKIMTNVVARLNNEEMKNQQEEEEETSRRGGEDHWNENALRIQADLTRMSKWVRNKSQDYISLEMKDDEASLIQSTVTSFAATTASELDTLRKIIPAETSSSNNSNNNNNDVANHRSGIVQILLSQLQEQITQPFGILQKQRTRVAVSIWQNPIQCKLYQPKINNNKNNDGDDGGGGSARIEEQRFIPRKQPLIPSSYDEDDYEHHDFISQYNDTIEEEEEEGPPVRPEFLLRFEQNNNNNVDQQQQQYKEKTDDDNFSYSDDDKEKGENRSTDFDQLKAIQQQQQQQQQHIPNYYDQQQQQNEQQENDILQEEARLLTQAIRHNDLDSVQKMEQRMTEITTLISQFSNLVSQQQEDIIQIHDASKDAKQNIDKGKENLIDAAEKTKQSKHYMAYSILIMSVILIFFDLLRN